MLEVQAALEIQDNMGKILLGTSGYSYKEWQGVLYPPGLSGSDYLKFYASEFGMTELNFTYYRMPDAGLSQRMVSQTGPDFIFTVKAHKTLTHEVSAGTLDSETRLFLSGIAPIIEAGKLGAVLLQFPFSFHYNRENRTYLDRLCARLSDVPLAVEFRNGHWQSESVYNGLRERDIAIVNVDEPHLPGLLKPCDMVTSHTGYVRFHGRNKENWWRGDNVSRYDYHYSDAELSEWIPRIMNMAARTAIVLVVFNNHSKGQAVQNARRLREMLSHGDAEA